MRLAGGLEGERQGVLGDADDFARPEQSHWPYVVVPDN
jgi:hypothetical protein